MTQATDSIALSASEEQALQKPFNMETFKFAFRKDKLGNKRGTVEIALPVPNAFGISQILKQGGKELQLVLDALSDVVRAQGLEIVADENITAANFPVDKTAWTWIANISKEDRRSSSIPAETWAAFAADYIAVMPEVSGRTKEQAANAAEVYLKKFSICKTDKGVLRKLQTQLGIYMEQPSAESFSDILEVLVRRLDGYLNADDVQAVLSNLGD